MLANVMLSFKPFLFGPRARYPHELLWDWTLNAVVFGWELLAGIVSMATFNFVKLSAPAFFRTLPYSGPTREIREKSIEILELADLGDSLFKMPHQLSGGQRQRAALSSALVVEPLVLCMDEPLSALDPTTKLELRQVIKNLRERVGCFIFYITHDVEEAIDLADRIIVLSTRPATVLEDIHLPRERPDGWETSLEHDALEERILTTIRDAARGSDQHGELTVTV